MSRKSRNPNFDQTLENLRAHSFDVTPVGEVSGAGTGSDAGAAPGGVLVAKYGAGAVLVPQTQVLDKDAAAAFAVHPGVLIRGQVARLLDRGYQKFIKTDQFELPATASQLHAIHQFSEELRKLTGNLSLYNESLGTTSDLYRYDRLRGREAGEATGGRPWDAAEAH